MLVSAIFGSRVMIAPHSLAASSFGAGDWNKTSALSRAGGGGGVAIECSSRPKKKATAHHMKTRPRKTQPWDIKRKPTVYPPLPPLPPDWTLVSSAAEAPDSSPPPSGPSPQPQATAPSI
ncbi:hypothetical protein L6164_015943 [Bauhinia variegata]|uniref:Uncharacterized protein n=1 Tax=Bauhinia variegata TaxID=167791 RepID=A0ACB9NM45_BAUVA|nr:hypothetical protein L6164_015943 [Bauhinia variegata]